MSLTINCSVFAPGYRYIRRSETSCDIECEPCDENRYTDIYNLEGNCNVCDVCKKGRKHYSKRGWEDLQYFNLSY